MMLCGIGRPSPRSRYKSSDTWLTSRRPRHHPCLHAPNAVRRPTLLEEEANDMPRFRGVIFDVDGTLIDSNDAHARAWVDALAEASIDVPFERIRGLIGMGGDKLMPEVCPIEKESPAGQQISERRSHIFKTQYLSTIQGFPEAAALLKRLVDDGYKLGVATSAQQDELKDLLGIVDANNFFAITTTSSDAEHSKPDPDIVEAALDRLRLRPDEAVMIGDTAYDIESATKAGVPIIALRSGGWNDEDLKGAIAIYDDPADLLAQYDESPLAREHALGR